MKEVYKTKSFRCQKSDARLFHQQPVKGTDGGAVRLGVAGWKDWDSLIIPLPHHTLHPHRRRNYRQTALTSSRAWSVLRPACRALGSRDTSTKECSLSTRGASGGLVRGRETSCKHKHAPQSGLSTKPVLRV
jgi:hypothetical protein